MKTTNKSALLIGAPSTGKTSVLEALSLKGYTCFEEISRQVTLDARAEGVEHLFKEEPLMFSEKLLEARIKQFIDSSSYPSDWTFLDRGLPDITAYMDMVGQAFPEKFDQANRQYIYDRVFWFPVWEDIHMIDSERYEDYKTSCEIEKYLLKSYKSYEYDLIEVPKASIAERLEFIFSKL